MKELDVVQVLEQHFCEEGIHVIRELPFLQRRVDLVGLDPSSSNLIAVEAKVKNWRNAFKQAITCLLFADHVFIALPNEFIHRVDASVIEEYGIGLIQVNSSVEIIIPASRSRYSTDYHRRWVLERVLENLGDNEGEKKWALTTASRT